ncbi:MAG: NrtA/SsuA/CpmA family ABC transporter substrate-binding protein [Deltaproteobacteria bacterium]|jgi:NitT/TauT family transport system substrate-binding protein/sulfonate transport system substrate-binding protein|nr:NrtA/SsuA/CpmA family ABC transporter substrate-binding protein [Deltaproteobacteria bacterium]
MKRNLQFGSFFITLFIAFGLISVPAAPAAALEAQVTISYVKSPFNLQSIVMKEHQLLEKELAPLGVSVNWVEINSGARQAQALAAGDMDVAGVMNSTSLLMGVSEGLPLKYVAGVARPTDLFAIIGRPDKFGKSDGPTSIANLKGKTVVGPMGTVLHQLLAAALAREGLSVKDVRFVSMDIPQSFAALQSGQADAALLAGNMIIKAEAEGAPKLATAAGLVTPKLGLVATDDFIANHPDRLRAVIAAHDKAWSWIEENHAEAMALGAKIQGISLEEAELFFAWSHFTQRMSAADIESMKDDMQFLLDNNMMRRPVEVETLFIPQALE